MAWHRQLHLPGAHIVTAIPPKPLSSLKTFPCEGIPLKFLYQPAASLASSLTPAAISMHWTSVVWIGCVQSPLRWNIWSCRCPDRTGAAWHKELQLRMLYQNRTNSAWNSKAWSGALWKDHFYACLGQGQIFALRVRELESLLCRVARRQMFDVGSSSAICFGTLVSGLIERGLDLKIYDGRHKNAYNLTCIWHILFPKRRPPDTTCGHSPVESRRKGCLPSLNSPNASYPDDNKCLTPMASASKEMRLNGGKPVFPLPATSKNGLWRFPSAPELLCSWPFFVPWGQAITLPPQWRGEWDAKTIRPRFMGFLKSMASKFVDRDDRGLTWID